MNTKNQFMPKAKTPFSARLEILVDRLIPWMIVLLLFLIVVELFFHSTLEQYHLEPWTKGADFIVVFVFILDLWFKYRRASSIPFFLRKYWLDILAVFPFVLFFRTFEGFYNLFFAESLESGQKILHEGLELERGASKVVTEVEKLEKGASRIIREAEEVAKVSRAKSGLRFVRFFARSSLFFIYLPPSLLDGFLIKSYNLVFLFLYY